MKIHIYLCIWNLIINKERSYENIPIYTRTQKREKNEIKQKKKQWLLIQLNGWPNRSGGCSEPSPLSSTTTEMKRTSRMYTQVMIARYNPSAIREANFTWSLKHLDTKKILHSQSGSWTRSILLRNYILLISAKYRSAHLYV